jgi:hypothetical protein
MTGMAATVEFCGEVYPLASDRPFTIGREADLMIDENPFLHRHFLELRHADGLWWLTNVGALLSARLADADGLFQAWLAPGARLPVVFPRISVCFTAGPTTYELFITTDEAPFGSVAGGVARDEVGSGDTTDGLVGLTGEERLLLVALAEPLLRDGMRGGADLPSSAEAAARLGWSVTKLNRKLDSVCLKLERQGVRGLHGGPDRVATSRKVRLVEYALAVRLVRAEDVSLLRR